MQGSAHEQGSQILIAVMGATGAGKSTFIKLLTNDEKIRVGHKQQSETFDVETSTYIDEVTGRSVTLIDTPGFDDSREGVTDTEIRGLSGTREGERKVNGILYLHRISDPRVGGVSRKNLRMFHTLCGDKNLGNVRIVTTNWSRVSENEGKDREDDLTTNAFKPLIDAGARMRRHANTTESARQIVSELTSFEVVTIKIQEELQDGMKLADTAAGQVLTEEVLDMQKKHEREMAELRNQMELAAKARDDALTAELAQERKVLEEKIACTQVDREALERTLEEHREVQERRKGKVEQVLEIAEEVVDALVEVIEKDECLIC